jgi:hypothetical protein
MKSQINIKISIILAVILLVLFAYTKITNAKAGTALPSDFVESIILIPTGSGFNDEEVIVVGEGSNGEEGKNIIPNASSSNAIEGEDLIPTGIGSNGEEGEDLIPIVIGLNGDDDVVATTTPIIIPVITPSSGGSSGSSGGRSIFPIPVIATSTPIFTATSCNYISSYLRFGDQNNSAQVTKLQSFLKNIEKLDLDVSGVFDIKTLNAVKVFQEKYANEVLFPWGMVLPSGYVYYTTKDKINEIYCKTTFNLTPAQLADITAFKNAKLEREENQEIGTTTDISPTGSTTTQESSSEIGLSGKDSQAAATINTGFANKIWNFIKWLFGY